MNPKIIGRMAAVMSVVYMAMGLPIQIQSIWMAKSTEGVSFFATFALFAMTATWTTYGVVLKNYNILISNALGALFAFVILVQFWIYSK